MTDRANEDLSPNELQALEGEQLPDREVMSVVSPVPDGDLVWIQPDPGPGTEPEPSDQHPLPGPFPDKGESPPIDW